MQRLLTLQIQQSRRLIADVIRFLQSRPLRVSALPRLLVVRGNTFHQRLLQAHAWHSSKGNCVTACTYLRESREKGSNVRGPPLGTLEVRQADADQVTRDLDVLNCQLVEDLQEQLRVPSPAMYA